jgi:Ca-activated chloride channel homolog
MIRSTYFVLIMISILSPTFGGIKKEIKNNSKDIFIALDLTESMNCKDLMPNRLEKGKFEISKLIKNLQNDRVGIVIFTSKAYMHCPLTNDYTTLSVFLNTVKTGILKYSYTNIAAPLEFCMQKFKLDNSTNSKILVLVSDGEDFGEKTEDLIHELNTDKITLVTLGLGSIEGTRIPSNGSFKKDKSGNEILSKLNKEFLEEIANRANGKYFEISDVEQQTNQLIEYINTIESSGISQHSTVQVKANKYIYFLFIALILIVIDTLINVKIIRL